ncbi:hypothetical protein FACS189454_01300 [Planctomycetales bacterium]|nr:hypothetical protein FACS189454_01300 [Planctomycetales bacterium]
MFIPFFFPNLFVSNGEHLPTAEMFSPEATNYSFSEDYMRRRREFDIPEAAFLKMCKEQDWNPVLIETLPDLPPFDREHWEQFERDKPRINIARKCPLEIGRYCRMTQLKHKDCRSPDKCKFDPTGLTDDSCFHVVSKGYYFEARISNGGGIYVLYDLSNGRFYSEWNRR